MANKVKAEFPNFFRFITEKNPLFIHGTHPVKAGIILLIGLCMVTAVVYQASLLLSNRVRLEILKSEQIELKKEISYWTALSQKYPNYPDIHLKIASLYYAAGNIDKADKIIQKALYLDPESAQAKRLKEAINPENSKVYQ